MHDYNQTIHEYKAKCEGKQREKCSVTVTTKAQKNQKSARAATSQIGRSRLLPGMDVDSSGRTITTLKKKHDK